MSLIINFLTGAPRSVVPPTDPTPVGAGHFGHLLANLWESESGAGNFLGDASASPAGLPQASADAVAEVFNQHGLFAGVTVSAAGATSGAGQACPPTTDAIAATESDGNAVQADQPRAPAMSIIPWQLPGAPPPPEQVGLVPGQQPVSAGEPGSRGGEAIAQPVVRTSQAPDWKADLAVPIRTIGIGENAPLETGEIPMGRSPIAGRRAGERGVASAVQLTLQMTEQGANVTARAGDIDPQARTRLRERIGALLMRHGLRAGDVRLNGAARIPATHMMDEEK